MKSKKNWIIGIIIIVVILGILMYTGVIKNPFVPAEVVTDPANPIVPAA